MFKRLFNELMLVFDLSPHEAPLLIKSGRESGADPTLLDMNFVRTAHPRTGEMTVFLPGSSLKGTLRSYCEKIARTVQPDRGSEWCCNPFGSTASCGKRLEDEKQAAARYAGSCVACRTFGNTGLGSHLALTDAYPLDEPRLEQRDGVAIDRISGAVAAGPFNLEVVTQGTFRARLMLRNFQLWQVGLLAVALRDLGQGRVPIGFGKSKGFGRVTVTYRELEVAYPGRFALQSNGHDFGAELVDLAAFDFPGRADYRLALAEPASVPLPVDGREVVDGGAFGRVAVRWTDAVTIETVLNATVGRWRTCALGPWPPSEEESDE
jgi:CRISPR-associated RAMP protein (TIGR02581 family)